MTIQEVRPLVDMDCVPKENINVLARAAINKMLDIRQKDPEKWAQLYEEGKKIMARLAAERT